MSINKLPLLFIIGLMLSFTLTTDGTPRAEEPNDAEIKNMLGAAQECWTATAVKTNVLYQELINPIDVCVSNVSTQHMTLSVNEPHELVEDPGGWAIIPRSKQPVRLKIHEKLTLDGETRVAATREFRVKKIPDPMPKFGGKTPLDNTIKKEDLAAAAGVLAWVPNFDFEVNVKVTGFTMTFIRSGQVIQKSSKSNRVTDEMKANINKVARGQKVYIEQIEVQMPDASIRQLPPIALKVV